MNCFTGGFLFNNVRSNEVVAGKQQQLWILHLWSTSGCFAALIDQAASMHILTSENDMFCCWRGGFTFSGLHDAPAYSYETEYRFAGHQFSVSCHPLVQTAITSSQSAAGKSHKLPTGTHSRGWNGTNCAAIKAEDTCGKHCCAAHMLMTMTERRVWKR